MPNQPEPPPPMTVAQFLAQIQDAIAARPEVADFLMCVEGPTLQWRGQPGGLQGATFGCAGFMVAADEQFAYARIQPCDLSVLHASSTLEPKL